MERGVSTLLSVPSWVQESPSGPWACGRSAAAVGLAVSSAESLWDSGALRVRLAPPPAVKLLTASLSRGVSCVCPRQRGPDWGEAVKALGSGAKSKRGSEQGTNISATRETIFNATLKVSKLMQKKSAVNKITF